MLPGCQAPTAEAPGDATAGSPLLTDAAAVRAAALNSRRPAATAANASGADGSAPLSPARTGGRALTRFTDPDTDAARATVEEPVPAKPAGTTERDATRGRDDDCARDDSDDPEDDTAPGPRDPAAVSAAATGIDAIAAPTPTPTPSATANAPTRPTYHAHLCADGVVSSDSKDRTRDTGSGTELIAAFLQNGSRSIRGILPLPLRLRGART
ncbi:MAG: hypothetical protein WD228_08220 [Mycobacterium sp.]